MNRRGFLSTLAISALGLGGTGCRVWPDEGFWNPCYEERIPASLLEHELVLQALAGIDFTKFWDCHTHLIGVGDNQSKIWVNPNLRSLWHPIQKTQFSFYMNASCADEDNNVDQRYKVRLRKLLDEFPVGAKSMLLAFDFHHDSAGNVIREQSPFYTPNAYAQQVAVGNLDRFEWIASIHPYRRDAIEVLDSAIKSNARAIKWLPQAMGIDPSSPQCDRFYAKLASIGIPLLSHAGDEHAVDAGEFQKLGNPLLLRRPLEHGVKVIVAHCASMGSNVDIDKGKNASEVENSKLFARLMAESKYEARLFGDISAITQINRSQENFEMIYQNESWQHRLVYGSDYPLPGVMPIFSPMTSVDKGYISAEKARLLSEIRKYNPLLFDFLYKRMIQVKGSKLSDHVFHSKRVFIADI